jgi:nucleoside-diphosphate-sugar epimerase
VNTRRVLVAGAGGAIGRVLCRLLRTDGWEVYGTTRSAETAERLHSRGVVPVLVDVFDRDRLIDVLAETHPTHVMQQLTDLPKTLQGPLTPADLARNARIRAEGTANLACAAQLASVGRFVAQSVAFAYAPGTPPYEENAPLLPTATAVATLERLTLSGPHEGVVLRYGRLYGPGTWADTPPPEAWLHVEAAADAARRALTRGAPGIYNIAEPGGNVSIAKARTALGWDPAFRLTLRA